MKRSQTFLLVLLIVQLAVLTTVFVLRKPPVSLPRLDHLGLNEVDQEQIDIMVQQARRRGGTSVVELARSLAAVGLLAEAESCYASVAPAMHDPEVTFEWAFALGQLGHAAEAVERFHEALALYHEDPGKCWYFIGQNELRQEHAEQARAAFQQAEPMPAATYELAKLANKTGNPTRAEMLSRRVIEMSPESYTPYLTLARALQLLGNEAGSAVAADRWNRLAQSLPTPFDDEHDRVSKRREQSAFLAGRQDVYHLIQAGRFAEATAALDRLASAEFSADLADLAAEVAMQQGDWAGAESFLRRGLDWDGPSLHMLWRLGDAVIELGRREEAVALWERAARLGAKDREVDTLHTNLAGYYASIGNSERAAYHQQRAWRAAGRAEVLRGKFSSAVAPLQRAVQEDPDDLMAWYYLAEAFRYTRATVDAQGAYERCLQLDPNYGPARRGLAILVGNDEKTAPKTSPRS